MARTRTTRIGAKTAPSTATVSLVKDLRPRDGDAQYYGPEPNFAVEQPDPTRRQGVLGNAYTWYSHFYGGKDAKEFLIKYLEDTKSDKVKLLRKVPDNRIISTAGWVARCVARGLVLEAKEATYLSNAIDRMIESAKADPVLEETAPKPARQNIQEVMKERASEAGGEIEGMFDDYHLAGYPKEFDTKKRVMQELTDRNILPQHVTPLINHWNGVLAEYIETQAGKCDQLNEAYSFMSKTQLKNVIKFVESIIADLNGYVSLKQVAKKPRAKKAVPVEKIVAKLKYCKTFKDDSLKLEIVSLPPTKLHNSTEAWVYDTKKRKLHHYIADEYAKCLSVKGNALLGFDKKQSEVKTLRKPADQLKEIMGSKPAARKFFKDIKAVSTTPNGRFNDGMVILKAF